MRRLTRDELVIIGAAKVRRRADSTETVARAVLVRVDFRRRDPTRSSFCAHFPSPQFLDNVTEPEPQHADRHRRTLARHLVIDCHLDLVRLVHAQLKLFVPAVTSRWMGSGSRRVFDFDVDDGLGRVLGLFRLRSVSEVTRRFNRDLQRAGERFSNVGSNVFGNACVCVPAGEFQLCA